MNSQDLRALSEEALMNELSKAEREYWSLTTEVRSQKERNHAQVATHRRTIARIRTILTEKYGN